MAGRSAPGVSPRLRSSANYMNIHKTIAPETTGATARRIQTLTFTDTKDEKIRNQYVSLRYTQRPEIQTQLYNAQETRAVSNPETRRLHGSKPWIYKNGRGCSLETSLNFEVK